MGYRKNTYRRDIINRFGETAGTPLFDAKNPLPDHVEKRLDSAPKSIFVASETRKLGEVTAKIDEMKLADTQQTVLDTMYLRDDWTYQELAEKLEWSVNRVIPRVYELRQLGLVVAAERRICSVTGMVVQSWKVK